MTTRAISVPRPEAGSGDGPRSGGFGSVLRAEWIKFRSVRGWVIGMILAALLTVFLGVFAAANANIGCQINGGPPKSGKACLPYIPHGPGGEIVTDSFYFVRQPLTGNGTITAEVTSLTGEHANLSSGPAQVGSGTGARPGGVGQGGDHHQAEHPSGLGLRGDDGDGQSRGPDAVQLHRGYRRDAWCRLGGASALAAADSLRRHDHRLRLRRRHALDPGGHGPAIRAAVDRPGRHVRHLAGLHGDPELVRRLQQ